MKLERWWLAICRSACRREQVELYECHEGNKAITNILSAARAAEREQSEEPPR